MPSKVPIFKQKIAMVSVLVESSFFYLHKHKGCKLYSEMADIVRLILLEKIRDIVKSHMLCSVSYFFLQVIFHCKRDHGFLDMETTMKVIIGSGYLSRRSQRQSRRCRG